jgi:hypothetical protein
MWRTPTASRCRGRSATRLGLRALALFAVLLLGGSSLGQVAHFILVPHAICAEHGELLELHDAAAHGDKAHDDEAAASPAPASVSLTQSAAAEHDHCQVLARSERELSLPASAFQIAEAPSMSEPSSPLGSQAALSARSPLILAPKTSPPRALLG